MTDAPFAARGTIKEIESGLAFAPKFDEHGLIPCIATNSATGEVVMFAWMNAEALSRTIASRQAHYWSRSRNKLWRKGEDSGNEQTVVELRTDCDQDVILIKVRTGGDGENCHTGHRSCFYRSPAVRRGGLRLVSTRPHRSADAAACEF
jgi:phosphoribosyl-AMP cyclohydrolase